MFTSNLINFGALLNKFDIEVVPVEEATKDDSLNLKESSKDTTQFFETDSQDLKAVTRSSQRLAATASLWLDRSDWTDY